MKFVYSRPPGRPNSRSHTIIWPASIFAGPVLSSVARELLLPAAAEDVVETIGTAGDVMLTHPLLLHAR